VAAAEVVEAALPGVAAEAAEAEGPLPQEVAVAAAARLWAAQRPEPAVPSLLRHHLRK
jgi:hypothetical protein